MTDVAGVFTVVNRFRVTWDGAWLTVACLVFSGAGVALIVRGGRLDIAMGVLALLVFGVGGLLAASRVLSRRPVLAMDQDGVRLLAPWPRSHGDDVLVPWDDLARLVACTQVVPHRGGSVGLHWLVFVTREEAAQPVRPPKPWHPHHAVRIHHTWDHAVEEVVTAARRHRPDLPFEDRRTLDGHAV